MLAAMYLLYIAIAAKVRPDLAPPLPREEQSRCRLPGPRAAGSRRSMTDRDPHGVGPRVSCAVRASLVLFGPRALRFELLTLEWPETQEQKGRLRLRTGA